MLRYRALWQYNLDSECCEDFETEVEARAAIPKDTWDAVVIDLLKVNPAAMAVQAAREAALKEREHVETMEV